MKSLTSFATALLLLLCSTLVARSADTRCFEMRVYYANEGKLDALHARFREHTLKLFEKHGMTNLGYFVPLAENPERKLIYFLAYPNREARDKAWAAFRADPAWQSAQKASEVNGKLVAKVDSVFLQATDYSPLARAEKVGNRVFELRTYTTPPERLAHLNARFRGHTVKLFEKHGMTNLTYWTPMADQKGAQNPLNPETTLIYLLAHASEAAGKASFSSFGKDPEWVAARKASEEKAGGSLTVPKGVVSLYLKPTDYSPVQ